MIDRAEILAAIHRGQDAHTKQALSDYCKETKPQSEYITDAILALKPAGDGEVERLRAELAESKRLFDAHIEAVKKWTTELAGYLPFMDDGKVTPQDFIVAASAAQQWQENLKERCLKAEAALALAQAQVVVMVVYAQKKSGCTPTGAACDHPYGCLCVPAALIKAGVSTDVGS